MESIIFVKEVAVNAAVEAILGGEGGLPPDQLATVSSPTK